MSFFTVSGVAATRVSAARRSRKTATRINPTPVLSQSGGPYERLLTVWQARRAWRAAGFRAILQAFAKTGVRMLFRDAADGSWLAVSQPMHALVSGQMLRAWGAPGFAMPEPFEDVATAAAHHDVGWMEWEAAPTLDPATGRPHVFRAVGARFHAPMWAEGVARATASWGPWVGLLVSRHGSLIYARYDDRHQDHPEDGPAARHYRESQAAVQEALMARIGATEEQVAAASALVAVTDALSLAVCGGIATMGGVGQAPMADGSLAPLSLTEGDGVLAISPWPFRVKEVRLSWRARRFGAGQVWMTEAAMRASLAAAPVEEVTARLVPG